MLNMIKMDLYRMFKAKSMYVLWLVLAGLLLMGTFLTNYALLMPEEEIVVEQETITETDTEGFRFGIVVDPSIETDMKVSVFDEFYGNATGGAFAIFMVVFSVLFSTADISSGYIKNIGGQLKNRGLLMISKAIALFVFTVLTLIGSLILQAILNQCIFGYLEWGETSAFVSYVLTQIGIHYGLVIICAAIAVILKNNVFSMTIAICLTMNMMNMVYTLMDLVLDKMGFHNLTISKYTVTGQLSMLPMSPTGKECLTAFVVAAVFIAVMLTVSSKVFQKRDI